MINDTKDLLIVKDNFFNKDIYEKILINLSTLNFVSRNVSLRENQMNEYESNKVYFNVKLNLTHFAVQEVSKLLSDYGFNLKKREHSYFLSGKHKEAFPHQDEGVLNCIVYLKGKELLNSGTGFYDRQKDNLVLNRHIGFKENRAIMFDPKIFHSSLQFNEGAGTRYIMSNFFDRGKEKNE